MRNMVLLAKTLFDIKDLCQSLLNKGRDLENRIRNWHTRSLQSLNVALSLAGIAEENAPGVPHRLASGSGTPGDKGHHRLGHRRFDVLCRILFIAPADLAAHHYPLRLWISLELLQITREGRSNDRIAADADAGGLPNARLGQQRDDLVSSCTGAGDKANGTWLEDLVRDNADLANAWRTHGGAVGTDQRCPMLAHHEHRARHIDHRNILRDAHDQLNASSSRLHDRIGSAGGWNKDARGVGTSGGHRLGHCIEDRPPPHPPAALSRSDAAPPAPPRREHVLGMAAAL